MTLKNRDHLKYVQAPFVLLENSLTSKEGGFLFEDPHDIIIAETIEEVEHCFEKISKALELGYYVAGYMTYELGLCFEEKLHEQFFKKQQQLKEQNDPLLWFGVFQEKLNVTSDDIESWLEEHQATRSNASDKKVSVEETLKNYKKKFEKVKANIAAGDIYQLNLTFKGTIENQTSPLSLYEHMRRSQPVEYASIIVTKDKTILSASPELFLNCQQGEIETRPMKGTMKRGVTIEEDQDHVEFLKADKKSRAEN